MTPTSPPVRWRRVRQNDADWDCPVTIGRVRLRNPVIASSGTYGYGLEYSRYGDPALLGAVVVKSLTVEPRTGFPPPRVTMLDEPGSMLNAIGVPNPGVTRWAEDILPAMVAAGAPVVASIWGTDDELVVGAAELLAPYRGPIAWEVNLSCPNSDHPGSPVSHDPVMAGDVCRAVRALAPDEVGVWAKLSPDAPDVVEVARACHAAGVDAVTVSNTHPAVGDVPQLGATTVGGGRGGMSGGILRQYVRPLVEKLAATHPEIPVIACGGVLSSEIAHDYLQLGARAVEVGTASLYDPRACHRIARGLVRRLKDAAS
jgi:dihydroorotate dehydrogenase (NAD+) catalytic subunit